jgi:nitrous oxidase accessory protein
VTKDAKALSLVAVVALAVVGSGVWLRQPLTALATAPDRRSDERGEWSAKAVSRTNGPGSATGEREPSAESRVPGRVCPPDGRLIPAGAPLQPILDGAAPGSVLCLSAGEYAGPIVLRTRIVLQGPADAVVRSNGEGTTVRVLAGGAELRGFTVDGSGHRPDIMDAAVLARGEKIAVRGLTIRHALFGLVAEQSFGVVFEGNHVIGEAAVPEGERGDGIRLWEVRGASVLDNHLEDSRDIVVWYSPGNLLAGNTVLRSRYATHFMYSSDCVVRGNRFRGNTVGVFVMYSRNIAIRDNEIADNTAADSMGLGVKDSGDLIIERNRLVRDRQCLYLDNSPFREGDVMIVRSNTIAGCSAGVTFHKSEARTTFEDNRFEGNSTTAAIEGRGTARDVTWRTNYFDDYEGYDLDADGFGDVPYELRDASERLVSRRPELAFFRGTAALALVDVAARAFPILQPETLLVDERPRMEPARAMRQWGNQAMGQWDANSAR